MPRVRSIHPGAPVDEDVATMSVHARLVWAYLPCHADREGRLRDAPFTLKLAILPADDVDMNAILDELAARRHVLRYEVDGRPLIQIRSFSAYQTPHPRESASVLPPPPTGTAQGNAKVSLRQTLASLGPTKVVTGPSDPDPDPDPDPESVNARACDPSSTATRTEQWSAHRWMTLFGHAWGEAKGKLTYGFGSQDAKAMAELGDLIGSLPPMEVDLAQARAPAMFADYLADDAPTVSKAQHPFRWFVERFNALRLPQPDQSRPRGAPRQRTDAERRATALPPPPPGWKSTP